MSDQPAPRYGIDPYLDWVKKEGLAEIGRNLERKLRRTFNTFYDEKGAIVPVTVVEAGPCIVTQVKTVDSDGYFAVQMGFGEAKPKHAARKGLLAAKPVVAAAAAPVARPNDETGFRAKSKAAKKLKASRRMENTKR